MNLTLVNFLRKRANGTGAKIVVGSAISGLANGLFVVIINAAAKNYTELNFRYLVMFALCIAIYIITKKYALYQTAIIIRNAISETHIRITDKIRRCSLISFEDIGKSQIYTTLSENVEIIVEASRLTVSSSSAAVMLVFSFTYVAFLSLMAFWFTLILLFSGVCVFLFNQKKITEELRGATKIENEFFGSLGHFLSGFKEVKMNREKAEDLFSNYLKKISVSVKQLKTETESKFISNHIFAQLFFYILIASIVFLLPQISPTPPRVIISLIAVILFIIGPVGIVVDAMPIIAKANIAVEKLKELENLIDAADDIKNTLPDGPLQKRNAFSKINLRKITFKYPDTEGQRVFSIGPVDLTINTGEVLFIVGGNGTGKTTLLKIITGLYYPQDGVITLDDIAVDITNYAHYRRFFSVIFADFHLFDRLYGIEEIDKDRLDDLLDITELSEKTSYIDGKFSNINLSTGQRKRLALIITLMENRMIYVFDEVAADQDPIFRKYFYEVLVKDLQNQGKTIICVTHDDRYHHVADRVLTMEYGRFINEK